MADSVAKGDDLYNKAEKKLKGWGLFGNKYDEAAELLEKAANYYKLGKSWDKATETYKKLADIHLKSDSKHDAATCYVEASKASMKVDPKAAVILLQQAVDLYTDMGRLSMAARQLREIAEAQEKQGLKEECLTFYSQAADLFSTENATSDSNKCRLKIAEFSAELERYQKAMEIYEDIAKTAMENNLLKFSAKGYLLNAGICLLCYAGISEAKDKLEAFKEIDFNFAGSRECNLLEQLVDALDNNDEAAFATAVKDFDSLTRLDAWKTSLMLRIKRRIEARKAGAEAGADTEEDDELL
jgi:alpha-soluble NSF attachment protein